MLRLGYSEKGFNWGIERKSVGGRKRQGSMILYIVKSEFSGAFSF